MNIKQLKDFRAKLKYAKKLCAFVEFNSIITRPFQRAELRNQCAGVLFDRIMPNDVFVWYTHPNRTAIEREAMWDNSIAAVDARIKKGK